MLLVCLVLECVYIVYIYIVYMCEIFLPHFQTYFHRIGRGFNLLRNIYFSFLLYLSLENIYNEINLYENLFYYINYFDNN